MKCISNAITNRLVIDLIAELFIFTKKQAQAAVFGGVLLVALILTKYISIPGIYRYDFLFIIAILTQAFLILRKYEEPKEIFVIALFHIAAMGMEIFKTSPSVGSWQYPEPSIFSIYNVPLFTGFMYSAIGSYIVRSWRINEFVFTNLPSRLTMFVFGLAIYINFFTNHFTYDIRYILFVGLVIVFWKTILEVKLTEKIYRIHPLISNALFAFIIWMSEQVGTFARAWIYPNQAAGWKPVSFHMFTSWYLLLVFSFILIALIMMNLKESRRNKITKHRSNKIIVVCGPTATGKSDLAVDIALYLQNNQCQKTEIISADSRQVYTGLDLGTGKITKEEMKGVPHHMLDICSPSEKMSVVIFQKQATALIEQMHAQDIVPIICGGTGMYIDSVIYQTIFPEVPPNPSLRTTLDSKSKEELLQQFQELVEKHNITSHQVDLTNTRRIIRAIEIIEHLGYIPELKHQTPYEVLWIGLDTNDEILKQRIEKRIQMRMDLGMLQESMRLIDTGLLTHERMQELGLEYAYISDLLQGKITREEFNIQLYFAIWHYAKRQRTWFKRNKDIAWFDALEVKEKGQRYKNLSRKIHNFIAK
jgi:tRNA dimethylallyltransferase